MTLAAEVIPSDAERSAPDVYKRQVYHEGYRIERLTLAGNDISEYKIEYPAEHNENMMFAISEFTRLVKQACGAVSLVIYNRCV